MPTINQLQSVTDISESDQFPIYSSSNGDARKASFTELLEFLQSRILLSDNKVQQYAAPSSTGFAIIIEDTSDSFWLIITPTGTLAAGAIKMPSLGNCTDNQEILVNSTNQITSLSFDGNGATLTGFPATIAADGFFRVRFCAVTTTWYRVG